MFKRINDHLELIGKSLDWHIEQANNVHQLVKEQMRPGPSQAVVMKELKELADDLASTIGQLKSARDIASELDHAIQVTAGTQEQPPELDRTIQSPEKPQLPEPRFRGKGR